MSPEKRKSAKNDYFAFYIGRPLTYVLTIPFLYTNISPNAVSYISFVPTIVGFVLLAMGKNELALFGGQSFRQVTKFRQGSLFSCGACWTELMEI